jgi:hypothetical protein
MSINCRQCNALLPAQDINQTRQLATCSKCGAVFPVKGQADEGAFGTILDWPDILLPKGISIESSAEELIIRRRWYRHKHILFAIGGLIIAAIYFDDPLFWTFFIWLSVALIYPALAGFLNTTVIRVNPNQLKISHGPLPAFGNRRLDPKFIEQLYVRQHAHRHKNSVSYTYEVYLKIKYGRDQKLLENLDTPEQALFVEQEIERFLGIRDERIPGEVGGASPYPETFSWKGWDEFAEAHHLQFVKGKLLESYRIFGPYRGYRLDLMAFRQDRTGKEEPQTRLQLVIDQGATEQQPPEPIPVSPLSGQELRKLFNPPNLTFKLPGEFQAKARGQELAYEQPGLITRSRRLQFLADTLYNLAEAYPKVLASGGEAMPILKEIALDQTSVFRAIAAQLLQDVALTTFYLRDYASILLCKRCLVHCTEHELELSWFNKVTYYGCRVCHQSREFFTTTHIVAVLDNQAPAEPHQEGERLKVYWLPHQAFFDFDEVEIISATDEDVERFAVLVGNDTNPNRRPRYKQIRCLVAADCGLSDNTIRILEYTFGQVEIKSRR